MENANNTTSGVIEGAYPAFSFGNRTKNPNVFYETFAEKKAKKAEPNAEFSADKQEKMVEKMKQFASDDADEEIPEEPSYYKAADGTELIQYMEQMVMPLHGIVAFDEGCLIKYIIRWRKKGGVTDLRKARWYASDILASLSAYGDACLVPDASDVIAEQEQYPCNPRVRIVKDFIGDLSGYEAFEQGYLIELAVCWPLGSTNDSRIDVIESLIDVLDAMIDERDKEH